MEWDFSARLCASGEDADLLALVGLGLLLYGLYIGLGSTPFFFCLFGIILIAAEGYNRRR